jgi:hypothetical protein
VNPVADDQINEDIATRPGRELIVASMRRVLTKRGFSGAALEAKITEMLATDGKKFARIFLQKKIP